MASQRRHEAGSDLPDALDLVELLDALPVMVSAYDGAGNYLFANARHALLHGGERSAFLGRPVSEMLGEAGYAGIRSEVERALAGERVSFDVTLTNPADGSDSTFSTKYLPRRDANGEADGFYSISSNITARKRAEKENEQLLGRMFGMQKLESLVTLAGGVAHDFNNLLVAVLANTELARDALTAHDALPGVADALDELEQIGRAAARASELSRQMLAYSGRGQLHDEVVDARSLASEMAELLPSSLGGVALALELPDEAKPVRVDPTQIRQVLLNLLTNAAEAGAGHGRVWLRIRRERVAAEALAATVVDDGLPGGDHVVIEVEDEGGGIAAEAEARIFEPFFSTKGAGRGLGLAACLGIVRGHRGAIALAPTARGTCFRVYLPASVEAADPPQPSEPIAREGGAAGRILVVDDEALVRRTMLRILERAGHTAVAADDGREAVEAVAKDPDGFDAVILDLTMPVMSGAEAFARIRTIAPALPVILCSGCDEEQVRNDCPPRAFDAVVPKPFGVDALLAAVQRVVR